MGLAMSSRSRLSQGLKTLRGHIGSARRQKLPAFVVISPLHCRTSRGTIGGMSDPKPRHVPSPASIARLAYRGALCLILAVVLLIVGIMALDFFGTRAARRSRSHHHRHARGRPAQSARSPGG